MKRASATREGTRERDGSEEPIRESISAEPGICPGMPGSIDTFTTSRKSLYEYDHIDASSPKEGLQPKGTIHSSSLYTAPAAK